MTYKKNYDKQEVARASQAKRSELHATLQSGAHALLEEIRSGKSERLLALLAFSGKFHRYSANNQLLILLQCLGRGITPQYIASFSTWKSMDYTVRKAEKGIAIYAPRPHRAVDTESGQELTQMFFKVSYVFADSQVEPMHDDVPPLPTFFHKLEGNCDVLYDHLAEVVRSDGIRIVEQAYAGAQGFSAKGCIGITPGLDSTSRFLTLIHEYVHELLHAGSTLEKRVKECQAEATSYIVAHHFGVHNPHASDYLIGWGNDEKTLLEELAVVQQTASTIITAMSSQECVQESDAA